MVSKIIAVYSSGTEMTVIAALPSVRCPRPRDDRIEPAPEIVRPNRVAPLNDHLQPSVERLFGNPRPHLAGFLVRLRKRHPDHLVPPLRVGGLVAKVKHQHLFQ